MEYIFINGKVITMEAEFSAVEAVLVQDNYITGVGTKKQMYNAAKTIPTLIDLKGKVLLPAFIDTHTHFVDYARRSVLVDLSACKTMQQISERITAYLAGYGAEMYWITGSGWDKNVLDHPELITKDWLDKICPHKPIALQSKDFHTKWCNSKALQIAGIRAGKSSPTGGIIGFDPITGEPDGLLYDEAAPLLEPYVESTSDKLVQTALKKAITEAWIYGLGGVHLMESAAHWHLIRGVVNTSRPLRLCWHFPYAELDNLISEGRRSYTGSEFYKYGGAKIFTDGALGSQSAYMFEPYPQIAGAGQPSAGLMRYTEDELTAMIHKAATHGISCSLHAIGDRANHEVINALLRNAAVSGNLMHRIEHVQCILPADIARLQQSGAYAALQPVHLANDVPLIESFWQGVKEHVFPFQTLVEAGIPYGFGSDVPVETANPFLGIYAALTRKPAFNPSAASWYPRQTLNLQAALFGYTLGAAMGSRSEGVRGSIAKGKLADLIVLDDFTTAEDTFWLTASSRLTMINGVIAHSEISF